MTALLLIAAIRLAGVTGADMTARAYFDVNNAKVGDPLVLTVDFFGDADLAALHPPALSKHVNREDWKVDDLSAKTETDVKRVGGFFSSREVAVARSLTYRVRPMREGVLWFPSLSFEYADADGNVRIVTANEIPVHARPGERVSVGELAAVEVGQAPVAPELVQEPGVALDDDALFAWRRACAQPSADAFCDFAFPAGRLNEASCAIREGLWRRALGIYSRLEWRVGQTPEIEQGIVAALAAKYDSDTAELPVWRTVGRPFLRHAWSGRLAWSLGVLFAAGLLYWLFGRVIRALACIAVVFAFAPAASGQGLFDEMERMMEESRRRMQQMQSAAFPGMGEKVEPPQLRASVRTEPAALQVGEPFEFILALESPRTASIGQIGIEPSETFGLTVTGKVTNMQDGTSLNPSNVVRRFSIPVRYDVPFKGPVSFAVTGLVSGRRRSANVSFTFSNNFRIETPPITVDIRPLPADGQPADFSGVIAENLRLVERLDQSRVGTNDIIQVTYHLEYRGYLPKGWRPKDVAFEIGRGSRNGVNVIEWLRYFVADGAAETPRIAISYYDPKMRAYRRAEAGGTHVDYE